MTFRLATSLFIGVDVGAQYDSLSALWQKFARGLVTVGKLDAPWTVYGSAMAAKRKLEPLLYDIVARQRQNPGNDALGLLIQSTDENGDAFTDEQLVAQIKILIFAGYDTTASTLTWLLAELLQKPEAYDRVRSELVGDAPTAPVTYDDLKSKPFTDAAIKETLRLHSQGFVASRGAKEGFEFGGYHVPAGWRALLMPVFTQRMEEYFANPHEFDPTRFMPPRDEDTQHPYAFVGFGGGPRVCIGAGIAQAEIKVFMTALLRRYDLKLLPKQNLTPSYVPLSRPKGKVDIAYTAR